VPELRPGTRVLDVGCGPGTITVDLAARVAPGEVIGIDPAAEVLDTARAAAEEAGATNVTFTTGDVYALDHDDASFDLVHAHQVLQHLADPVGALREMRRVCAPTGTVAARDSDYEAMTWYPARPELDRWLDLYRAVARHNGGEPDAGRHLLGWARAAGFAVVAPSASVWCFATPADRAWWGGLWADRVEASAFAEQAVRSGLADAAELARIAAGWRAWAVSDDGWFAVLHGEVRCLP
jgi:SAM-dependent methyltransferase